MSAKLLTAEDQRATAERERLLAIYYGEFRAIARRVLNRNGRSITLQPTDLVHEAALRMIASHGLQIHDEAHFLALGAHIMRKTLIDEIRRRKALKRDGGVLVPWEESTEQAEAFDFEQFDGILERLAQFEPQGARIVELRFFVGLTIDEIARVLDLAKQRAAGVPPARGSPAR